MTQVTTLIETQVENHSESNTDQSIASDNQVINPNKDRDVEKVQRKKIKRNKSGANAIETPSVKRWFKSNEGVKLVTTTQNEESDNSDYVAGEDQRQHFSVTNYDTGDWSCPSETDMNIRILRKSWTDEEEQGAYNMSRRIEGKTEKQIRKDKLTDEDTDSDEMEDARETSTEHEQFNETVVNVAQKGDTDPNDIVTLLKSLHAEIKGIRKDFSDERKDNKKKFQRITKEQQIQDKNISKLQGELETQKAKVDLLTGIVMMQDKQIRVLQSKDAYNDLQTRKANLIVGNIDESEQPENCMQLVTSFFKEKMQISQDILVRFAHRIGKKEDGRNRRIRIQLKNPMQKSIIFKNYKNLKGKENSLKQKYYVK